MMNVRAFHVRHCARKALRASDAPPEADVAGDAAERVARQGRGPPLATASVRGAGTSAYAPGILKRMPADACQSVASALTVARGRVHDGDRAGRHRIDGGRGEERGGVDGHRRVGQGGQRGGRAPPGATTTAVAGPAHGVASRPRLAEAVQRHPEHERSEEHDVDGEAGEDGAFEQRKVVQDASGQVQPADVRGCRRAGAIPARGDRRCTRPGSRSRPPSTGGRRRGRDEEQDQGDAEIRAVLREVVGERGREMAVAPVGAINWSWSGARRSAGPPGTGRRESSACSAVVRRSE